MKKISAAIFGSVLAFAVVIGLSLPASAQTDQKDVKCGTDQVAVGVAIGGSNCIDKGTGIENNVIIVWISSIIRFISVGIGLAVTAGVVYGGYLYMTAQGNAGKVQKAIATIVNSLLAVALYALTFALVNWLVPGGVLR